MIILGNRRGSRSSKISQGSSRPSSLVLICLSKSALAPRADTYFFTEIAITGKENQTYEITKLARSTRLPILDIAGPQRINHRNGESRRRYKVCWANLNIIQVRVTLV